MQGAVKRMQELRKEKEEEEREESLPVEEPEESLPIEKEKVREKKEVKVVHEIDIKDECCENKGTADYIKVDVPQFIQDF